MDGIFILCFYIGLVCAVLVVCGFIADYVLPHIPFIAKFLDSLPLMQDDDGYDDSDDI